jgi:hypothetical protein
VNKSTLEALLFLGYNSVLKQGIAMEKIVLTLKNFKGHQVVVTNKDADMLELQDMTWAEQWTWFVKMEKSFNKTGDWTATLEIV